MYGAVAQATLNRVACGVSGDRNKLQQKIQWRQFGVLVALRDGGVLDASMTGRFVGACGLARARTGTPLVIDRMRRTRFRRKRCLIHIIGPAFGVKSWQRLESSLHPGRQGKVLASHHGEEVIQRHKVWLTR